MNEKEIKKIVDALIKGKEMPVRIGGTQFVVSIDNASGVVSFAPKGSGETARSDMDKSSAVVQNGGLAFQEAVTMAAQISDQVKAQRKFIASQ